MLQIKRTRISEDATNAPSYYRHVVHTFTSNSFFLGHTVNLKLEIQLSEEFLGSLVSFHWRLEVLTQFMLSSNGPGILSLQFLQTHFSHGHNVPRTRHLDTGHDTTGQMRRQEVRQSTGFTVAAAEERSVLGFNP
jgi:hypothetical protein